MTVAPLVYYIIQRCMAHACNLVENNRLNLFVSECIFLTFRLNMLKAIEKYFVSTDILHNLFYDSALHEYFTGVACNYGGCG